MREQEKYRICVTALKDYVANAHFDDVVIGLSGGIDSSVTAVMCVDAFGADHVHGVLLPGPYSTDHSVDDAAALAHALDIETHTMSICEPYHAFNAEFKRVWDHELDGLASENTQARCRMVCLMALSNAHRWMLVNTGNKSEAMMGYSTLYGDTAGAFAPLGGLYKTDVYALGRWRNRDATDHGMQLPIPEHVFIKPPSAELAPEQQDEKSLGIDYASLDRILIDLFELNEDVDTVAEKSDDAEFVRHVYATAQACAYKRAMEPPYPDTLFYR
ncbi:MAG: NAD(+) synthase [Eggerthellaceae bacterium]|jgi:NAD+ synthase (glutamine-hydrolysing)|nr:NAD(+) synthase [Eggerthellaceae bacterium]MCH4220834.1 NAD(+) synthase [Eggerthellaceae bacterium]